MRDVTIRMARSLVALTTFGAGLASSEACSQEAPSGDELVKVTAASVVHEARAGEWFLIGFRFEIAPHWHIYWANPGDSGAPTVIEVNAPEGFEVGAILWPRPLNIPGEFITYGYEHDATLFVPVKPPKDASPGEVALTASVEWMVCRDECLLGGSTVSATVRVSNQPAPPKPIAGVREVTITGADGAHARHAIRFDREAALKAFDRVPRDLASEMGATIELSGRRVVLTGPAPGGAAGSSGSDTPAATGLEFFPNPSPGVAMRVIEQSVSDGRFRLVLETIVSPTNTRGVPPQAAGVIGLTPMDPANHRSYGFRLRLDTDGPMSKDTSTGRDGAGTG
ncbi:MAG: hypothetical protein HRU76_11535 [Phycisphaeraceae bacterium]|nr:hypothetical protein [Phycisphaerales bacterium]QOJ18184.1 MAG: hypothetical protein HRU76_11535 [Phycisphaeraceae bacterium]